MDIDNGYSRKLSKQLITVSNGFHEAGVHESDIEILNILAKNSGNAVFRHYPHTGLDEYRLDMPLGNARELGLLEDAGLRVFIESTNTILSQIWGHTVSSQIHFEGNDAHLYAFIPGNSLDPR